MAIWLTLKEFYAEYAALYWGAIPLARSAAMLKRFPLKEIPATLLNSFRLLISLRNAYRDYGRDGAVSAAE